MTASLKNDKTDSDVCLQSVAVILLTYNEQIHLRRAIESVRPFASEIFVIDSFSTDDTVQIARECGATVLTHPFKNYAAQFSWGLQSAPIKSDWVMRLDADEIIEPDLAREIISRLGGLPNEITGVNFHRKTIFLGKWIRFGGRFPLTLLRLWRRGCAQIEDRWMDEHMILTSGRAINFSGGFSDHNLNSLGFFTEKHNKYATREAIDVLLSTHGRMAEKDELNTSNTALQAVVKRFFKEKLYNRMPFEIGALAYFSYRYILLLGFLDGRPGAIYHFLQGFWYRFLVGAKVQEFKTALKGIPQPEYLRELSKLTGHPLSDEFK